MRWINGALDGRINRAFDGLICTVLDTLSWFICMSAINVCDHSVHSQKKAFQSIPYNIVCIPYDAAAFGRLSGKLQTFQQIRGILLQTSSPRFKR